MTREQAQLVLDHIDIIKHFAKGGMLEFNMTTSEGGSHVFPVMKGILINCLDKYTKVEQYIPKPDPRYCSRWCPLKRKEDPTIKHETLKKLGGIRKKFYPKGYND